MRRRVRVSSLLASVLLVATIGVAAAPPAGATPITYSGRGIALSGTVAGNNIGFGDTLALPSSGGVQESSLSTAGVQSVLGADTLHASTVGLNDRVRTEASAGGVTISVGQDSITADFVMTRAMAVSTNGAPTLSGTTVVDSLVVNNTAVTVTGAVNQIVTLPDGQLVVNERSSSTSGSSGSITVNALHVSITGADDVIFASSQAGLTSGSSNCSAGRQPTTGGGWITAPSSGKGTFGVHGRPTATAATGHLVYTDHGTGTKISGPVTGYQEVGNTAMLTGPATVNGSPSGNFTVTVQDNGEPGDTDTFSVETTGVPAQAAGGTLQGGNIQLHRPCH